MTQAANLAALGTNAGTTGILPIAGGGTAGTNGAIGFKNRIINGAMVIDQRNAGASITPTDGQFSLDRWGCRLSQSSKYSVQQNAGSVTPPTGFNYYLGVTSLSAYSVTSTDNFQLQYRIEGYNFGDLNWGTANAKTVTISFWVRSSLTGSFGASFVNADGNRSYPFSYTISSANTWTQISVTVAGDTSGTWNTTNGRGVEIEFSLGCGSTYSGTANAWASAFYLQPTGSTSVVGTNGATFYITGVQLEVGTAATNFDFRSYGTELGLCYRYYYQMNGVVNQDILVGTACDQSTWLRYGFALPTTMRTAPSLVSAGGTSYANLIASGGRASTSISLDNTSATNACVNLYSAGISAGTTGTFRLQAGLYLGFNAEL